MKKSIVIAREEFKEAIVTLINGSGLPYFVISDVMRQILADVDVATRRQYEMELAKQKESSDNKPDEAYDDTNTEE